MKKEDRQIKVRDKIIKTGILDLSPPIYREHMSDTCSKYCITCYFKTIREDNPVYDIEEMLDKLEDFISEHGPGNKELLNEFVCEIGLDKYVEWKQIEAFISSIL